MRGREWTCVVIDGRVKTCSHFLIYTSAFSVSLARAKTRSSITIHPSYYSLSYDISTIQIIVRFGGGGVNP